MFDARNWIAATCGLCAALWVACSNEADPAKRAVEPPSFAAPSGGGMTPGPVPPIVPPLGPAARVGPDARQFVRVVPTDTREVKQSPIAQPISGGTLIATSDDRLAIASDPERDLVSIIDLVEQRLSATIALEPGDEPGRLALDASGRVHVALRRSGEVASIDLATRQLVERRAACTAPRGIAFDAGSQRLIVACSSGELVTMPVTGTESRQVARVGSDLRDVVVRSDGVFATRLKSAELLALDAARTPIATTRPPITQQFFAEVDGSQTADTLEPVGARRTVATQDGMLMLHAGARNGDILVPEPDADSDEAVQVPGGASPYGGGGSCAGVVSSKMTKFDAEGQVVGTAQFPAALPVDIAESAATGEIAVAIAGSIDPFQPISTFVPVELAAAGGGMVPMPGPTASGPGERVAIIGVARFDPQSGAEVRSETGSCMSPTDVVLTDAPATAVTYLSDGRLLVQTREPAAVYIARSPRVFTGDGLPIKIPLGGVSVYDTGHEIFHRDAGAGVACASCHIEGGDDGHTWHFVDQGPRRTQSMLGGLAGAPFHWIGDMRDLTALMEHVFVGRMGGVHQSPERLGSLERWMNSIKAPPALRAASDPAVARGQALFVGEAECGTCHNGAMLTNNMTVDVGTGVALQVPSLIAIGYRSPWLHTGCAKTLQQRFDPACGGATHGRTEQLTRVQVDDLVAYLESL